MISNKIEKIFSVKIKIQNWVFRRVFRIRRSRRIFDFVGLSIKWGIENQRIGTRIQKINSATEKISWIANRRRNYCFLQRWRRIIVTSKSHWNWKENNFEYYKKSTHFNVWMVKASLLCSKCTLDNFDWHF